MIILETTYKPALNDLLWLICRKTKQKQKNQKKHYYMQTNDYLVWLRYFVFTHINADVILVEEQLWYYLADS